MADWIEHMTLGFSSGHDLTVCKFEPHIRLRTVSSDPAWDSLSLSLSLSQSAPLPRALSQNKQKKLKEKKKEGVPGWLSWLSL